MKLLVLFVTYAAVVAAFVPRIRRETSSEAPPTTSPDGVVYCAPTTTCGWTIYKPHDQIYEMNITNNYCICEPGLECQVFEDDTGVSALVYRCMTPKAS